MWKATKILPNERKWKLQGNLKLRRQVNNIFLISIKNVLFLNVWHWQTIDLQHTDADKIQPSSWFYSSNTYLSFNYFSIVKGIPAVSTMSLGILNKLLDERVHAIGKERTNRHNYKDDDDDDDNHSDGDDDSFQTPNWEEPITHNTQPIHFAHLSSGPCDNFHTDPPVLHKSSVWLYYSG